MKVITIRFTDNTKSVYRGVTSIGFANTWVIVTFESEPIMYINNNQISRIWIDGE